MYVFLFKFHSTVDLAHHYTYMHSKHIHKLFIAMFMRPHCDRILLSVWRARARSIFSDILICCCCCQQIDSICGVDRFRRWCFVCTLCHVIYSNTTTTSASNKQWQPRKIIIIIFRVASEFQLIFASNGIDMSGSRCFDSNWFAFR